MATKVITVKILREEDVKTLASLKRLTGEDTSSSIRQAIRHFEQHLRKTKAA